MFECQICKITTSTVFNYRAHLTSKKHISNLEKINSKAVDTINNNPQDLILDIQLHNQTKTSLLLTPDIYNKKATKFVCTCCNKSFASNFSLKRHVNKTELAQKLISNTDNINNTAWNNTLSELKTYLDTNKKRPSSTSKDPKTKILGKWVSHQIRNYSKKTDIMKNPTIYSAWKLFITSPSYKQYFK